MIQLAPPSLMSKSCDIKRIRAQRICEPNIKRFELFTKIINNEIENNIR